MSGEMIACVRSRRFPTRPLVSYHVYRQLLGSALRYICAVLAIAAAVATPDIASAQQIGSASRDIRTGVYRGRVVTYEVIDGLAVWDGDIILGTPEELSSAKALAPGKALDYRPKAVVGGRTRLWTGGIVPYVIDPKLSNPKVLEAIRHWNENTVIRLVERTDQPNWVRFVPANSGCRANVGVIDGGGKVFLAEYCGLVTVIHEIGHAVGLGHEQQRNDRDLHVWVQPRTAELYPTTFEKLGGRALDIGPYDYGSVMHYSFTGPLQTIPPGIPHGAWQGYGLSDGDIDSVSRLYGRIPTRTTVTTNPPGLMIEVNGESYTAPHSFDWAPGTVHTIGVRSSLQSDQYFHPIGEQLGIIWRADSIRYVFAKWSDGGSQSHSVTASPETTIFIANFIQQFRGGASAVPPHGGTVRFDPPSTDGFYTIFSVAKIFAEPAEGFSFERWEGNIRGGGQSTNPALSSVPGTYTALFTQQPLTTIDTNVPGSHVLVDGSQTQLPANFAWEAGSTHTLEVPDDVQYGGWPTTRRRVFQGWSDGGGSTRDITVTGEPTTITAKFHEDALNTDFVTGEAAISVTMPTWGPVGFAATIFITSEGETPPPQALEIRNSGRGTLDYRITTDQSWLSVSPTQGSSTGETDTIQIVVDSANLKQGAFKGTITITAAPARQISVPVTLIVTQGKALDFTHFVNGDGATSDLVFVNAGSDPSRPVIYFYDTLGNRVAAESVVDVTGNLEVQEDGALTVRTELEPLRELTISTHGRGELVTGSVKVILNGPIGGMLRYDIPGIGVGVAGASQPLKDVIFPVRRREGGITTGVALHNLEATTELVRCKLMSDRGLHGSVNIPLGPNGQTSWLIDAAFPDADTSDFVGSVRCSSSRQGARAEALFTAVALDMDPGNRIFITTPVVPVDRTGGGNKQTTLNFAHFVNGTWITDLVFVNLSTEASRPAIYFYDTEGNPIAAESVVDITGDLEIAEDGALTVRTEMEPLGVLTISTHGQGELVSGSVRVVSDGPIGGMLRFEHPDFGVAGVGASPPLSDALFPVRRQEGGITTGVALHNLESSPGLLRCDLMREGVLLDAASIPLEANGQTSWLIDQAFPAADTSDFAGSVRCDAVGEGLFSAVALEMDPGTRIFTTLPVVPVPQMPDRE